MEWMKRRKGEPCSGEKRMKRSREEEEEEYQEEYQEEDADEEEEALEGEEEINAEEEGGRGGRGGQGGRVGGSGILWLSRVEVFRLALGDNISDSASGRVATTGDFELSQLRRERWKLVL